MYRIQVWQTKQGEKFVRVIHEGTPVPGLEWTPLDTSISSLESQVPANIFELCNSS